MPDLEDGLARAAKGQNTLIVRHATRTERLENRKLKNMLKGKKHKKLAQSLRTTKSVLDMPSVSGQRKEAQVKEGEIRLVAFLNEHNLPHSAIEHLVPVVKAACPDSDIAKFRCGRTKCTAIIEKMCWVVKSKMVFLNL